METKVVSGDKRKVILIVDDYEDNCELLRRVLAPAGHTILIATSGEEALAMVRREHPDLVITDMLMPGMDGHELAQAIRADPTTAETALILSTSFFPYDKARVIGRADRVANVILLPIEPDALLKIVDETLAQQSPPEPDAALPPAKELASLIDELKAIAERKANASG